MSPLAFQPAATPYCPPKLSMPKANRKEQPERRPRSWPWTVALVALVVLFFWRCFTTDQILMSNDSSLSALVQTKALLPGGYISGWSPGFWLGMPTQVGATPTYFLLYFMSAESFARLIYVFHILALALIAFYWLRQMELSGFGAFFGALVMTFSGSYLTYILPGHLGKFEMTTFSTLSLLCLTRGVKTARWPDFAWAGVALGLALTGQPDTAALVALLIAAWFFLCIGRGWMAANDRRRRDWVLGFMLLMILSGLTAWPSVRGLVSSGAATSVPGGAEETSEQKWQWATQWSYPPREVIDLFAPGYHGWKSNDPRGPYRGALGRNPQFDPYPTPAELLKAANAQNPAQAQQLLTFWNFRLNSDFHGSATLMVILLALVALFANADPSDWLQRRRPEIIFWLAILIVALLFSFGRHFPPPFKLLHSLPFFGSMRNPNKLLVVITPAIAVLAALGADRLWRETEAQKA